MNFKFNVNVSDQDYLDYNKFWMLRSYYGKKQTTSYRIIVAALFAFFVLISLWGGNFTSDAFVGVIPMIIMFILSELLIAPLFVLILKGHIKSLKKKGKMGYSPQSVIEFGEDGFSETTEENKTEQKYSAIERISIVDNKMIYIHVNNVMAYMLPVACFESKAQYEAFLEFIKTKCANIDVY